MRDIEHRIQCNCVRWFRLAYPSKSRLLFAVPNGGARDAVTGAKLKAEGVVSGVADLLLLVPNEKYHALCIEMKTAMGRQSETQKDFQSAVEAYGYKYVVCRSIDDFMSEIHSYLSEQK